MDVVHRLDGDRGKLIEHGKVGCVQQLEQKLRGERYPDERLGGAAVRIAAVRRAVRVAVLGEALVDQLRGHAAQLVQRRLRYRADLLVVHEHDGRHDLQPILCIDRFDLWQRAPVHLLVAVLLPAPQIVRIQALFLVIDGGLRQHGHPERYHLRLAIVRAHLDIVHAQQQRFHAAAALLVARRDRIQVRVDKRRNELQREQLQFGLVRSIVVVQLITNGVQNL